MLRIYSVLLILSICFTSCDKLDPNYNKIPEDAPRMSDLQQQYHDMLVDSETGWFMEYQPGENNPSVPIWMRFLDNGKVHIISDREDFDQELISTFRVGGVIGPELIFDTYSVFSSIAETGGGSIDFRIEPQEDGSFVLKHATGALETGFILRKAAATDKDDILSRASVGRLLREFDENAKAYFRNLVLDDMLAFWDLDIKSQHVTLTWEETPGGERSTKTFSYTTLPGNGIRLSEVWQPKSNMEIQEIFFGEASPEAIEITQAGNAGAGVIEAAHIPAFPYPGTAKRFIYSNTFNTNQTPVRFYALISGTRETSEPQMSPALWPYYKQIWREDIWPTFSRMQVYNYNPVSNPSNSIQFYGLENGANQWLAFYYAFDEMDGSHVLTRKRNEVPTDHPYYRETYMNSVAIPLYEAHPEIADFLDRIYPPEGVTIVPLEGQRVRVVSRANSLYWFDLSITSPLDFYNN